MQPVAQTGFLSPWQPGIFSLLIYMIIVGLLTAALLWISHWLGARRPSVEKLRPYESGIIPTGEARLHYPVPFFLVAIFFLIFDVEGAFILSWAVSARSLGWAGWLQIGFFIFMLMLGLVHIWVKGGLEWGPTRSDR